MAQETTQYEEWLTTIANTRLLFNTMNELEDWFDNQSIHSNGIRRCFNTMQKQRAAYRDLKVEVERMTDGEIDLDSVMTHYQKAWTFFHEHLYRRANPEQVALELLSYCYPPYCREGLGAKKTALFKHIATQDISVPFLVLMLMKVVPGYDSKEGDTTDMPLQFERVMQLLEKLTANRTMYAVLPAIIKAKDEAHKTRLMLLRHVTLILNIYETIAVQENLYDGANDLKTTRINLDIVGFWNECGGTLLYTDFWQIEDALEYGTYFMTHWHKDADSCLTGIRYTLSLQIGSNGNIWYHLQHPEVIKHRMNGNAFGDGDIVAYQTPILDDRPSQIPMHRIMTSKVWPLDINLTRCVDDKVLAQYDRWINHDCEVVKPYKHLEYEFYHTLYAITQTHLYICSENEGEYYKVPKSSYEGFDCIQLSDNVGIMYMDRETYLVFDELLLYIGTGEGELQQYGIERVNHIE